MKPSDARVRQKKDQLQQARNARGKSWQDDLLAVLGGIPQAWARLWPADWGGQPYDIEATIDGRSWGIECKHIAKGNLPFSAFRPNERWRTSPARRTPAALPWWPCGGMPLPWTASSRGTTSGTPSRAANAAV